MRTHRLGASGAALSVLLLAGCERPSRARPAPEFTVTAARGVSPAVKIADYRGKWLLVEFWAHWCGPCTRESLPRLMDFAAANEKHAGKFAILTVHSSDVRRFDDLDVPLGRLESAVWKRRFPFAILLDDSGDTMKAWGVRALPAAFLVDPQGHIVAAGQGEQAEAKLAAALGR